MTKPCADDRKRAEKLLADAVLNRSGCTPEIVATTVNVLAESLADHRTDLETIHREASAGRWRVENVVAHCEHRLAHVGRLTIPPEAPTLRSIANRVLMRAIDDGVVAPGGSVDDEDWEPHVLPQEYFPGVIGLLREYLPDLRDDDPTIYEQEDESCAPASTSD
ncbi:MAG: hypothetical protein SH850_22585 [Planctomycetaceae bacterium]|nr:hypothetical protein [Planctomycetaceae bacterium]